MPIDFNQQIIDEFRANNGKVGGMFAGARLLLLRTTGARSGAEHTVPLAYLPDGDGRVLVIASAGGSPRNPAWYHNLLAHPVATVDNGMFSYRANATVLAGSERAAKFARVAQANAGWAEYERKSGRELPVVALEPEPGPPNWPSPAAALTGVHAAFRQELSRIRTEIAESGATLGAQLRINCLTLCQGLDNHHAGEDLMLFPALERDHPELAPAIAVLRVEHDRIAELLAQLRAAIGAEHTSRAELLADVVRLTAELEAHLGYEEEQLLPILAASTPQGGRGNR